MTFAAGALSLTLAQAGQVQLASAAATGGTGPYTYQLYMSTTTGFTPGAGNLVAGATSLAPVVTGLVQGTTYYFVMIATDTGNSNATANSAQFTAITTADGAQNQNQFAMAPHLGQLDQRFNFNTKSVQVDSTQSTPLIPGQAVKMVASPVPGGLPKVVGVAADSDQVFGFIQYSYKDVNFVAGSKCEISQTENVQYLVSVGAINAGAQVQLDTTYVGGVKTITGSSGANIVGYALDTTTGAGQLLRVSIKAPNYNFA